MKHTADIFILLHLGVIKNHGIDNIYYAGRYIEQECEMNEFPCK